MIDRQVVLRTLPSGNHCFVELKIIIFSQTKPPYRFKEKKLFPQVKYHLDSVSGNGTSIPSDLGSELQGHL